MSSDWIVTDVSPESSHEDTEIVLEKENNPPDGNVISWNQQNGGN